MARKKRLSPNQLAKMKDDFAGLLTIQNYTPAKAELKTSTVQTVDTSLTNLLTEEAQVEAHLADIRNQIADKGTEFTQMMKGVRQQIVAQFGDDSPEFEAVGGTRTSARRTGLRRSTTTKKPTPNG